jgi:uncharacterized protein (TIGR03382 family)
MPIGGALRTEGVAMMPGFSVESPGEWLMAVLLFVWPLAGPVVMAALGAASRSLRVGVRRTAMAVSALIVLFVTAVLLIASYPERIITVGGDQRYRSEDIRDMVLVVVGCAGVVTILPWLVAYLVVGRRRRRAAGDVGAPGSVTRWFR